MRKLWRSSRLLWIQAALLAVWIGAPPLSRADTPACIGACAVARAIVADLVATFEADKAFYTSRRFSEADTRARFIDPFFDALGWDTGNRQRRQLFTQDTVAEARLRYGQAMRYSDYGFRIDARAVFFVEAKAVRRDIDDPDHVFQARRSKSRGCGSIS